MPRRVLCSPSILAADLACAAEAAREVLREGLERIHYDVMDGVFVPNLSFGPAFVRDVMRAVPDLKADVHLMVQDPTAIAEMFLPLRPESLTFHVEACRDCAALLDRIASAGIPRPGLSISPDTPLELILPYLPLTGLVLVMTVRPGFYGQPYLRGIEHRVETLRRLREERGLPFLIAVDGGIDRTTFPLVRDHVDIVVAGAAFFRNPERAAFLADLGAVRG